MNFDQLYTILEHGTKEELQQFCVDNSLEIKDNKIYHTDAKYVNEQISYWDKRQLIRKISLNSIYGGLLNSGCRFFDKRLGQSTTLTGRSIVKHMSSVINEIITGDYNHTGDAIIYGDSVTGDSLIDLHNGQRIAIEDLFNNIEYKVIQDNGKEYAIPTESEYDLKVLGYNSYEDIAVYNEISYVMRHKTTKQLYKITIEDGTTVTVTEDHSLIIDRDGFTIEAKPTDLKDGDLIISVDS